VADDLSSSATLFLLIQSNLKIRKSCFMKRKPSRKILESLCGQPGLDDGVDPRDFFKPARSRRTGRKDWQLCRQVSETLNSILSGECRDDVLQGLYVCDVQPHPDATRLLVTVGPLVRGDTIDPGPVIEHLHRSNGWLRSEVARSISRRKVPELMFRVVPDIDTPDLKGGPR
jgi:ribosome-binding factor A